MEWIEIAYAVIIIHTILRNIEGYSYVQNHGHLEKRMVSRNSVIRDHYMLQNMKPHYINSKNKHFINLKFMSRPTNEKPLNEQPELSNVSFIKNSPNLPENKKHLFHINHINNNFVISHRIPLHQGLFTRKSEFDRKVLNSTILKVNNVTVKTCSKNNQNCLQLRKYAHLEDHLRANISLDCKTNINDCEKFNTKLAILHITNREIHIPATSIRLKRNIEENRATPLYFSTTTEIFKLIPREKHNNSYLRQYKSSEQHIPFLNGMAETSSSVSDMLQNLASELTRLNKTLLFILSQALAKHNDTKISKETIFPEIKTKNSLLTQDTSALNNLKNSKQLTLNSTMILYNYTDIKGFKGVSVTSTVSSLQESNIDSALKNAHEDFISTVKNIQHSVEEDYERNRSDLCQKSSGVTLSTMCSNFVNQVVHHNFTSFNNIKMNTSQNNYKTSSSFKGLFSETGYEYSSDVPTEAFSNKNINKPSSEKNDEYSMLFPTEKSHIKIRPTFRNTKPTSNPPSETPESYRTEIFTWTQRSKSALDGEQIISTPVSGWNFTLENISLSDVIENFKRIYPVTLWESEGFFTEKFLFSINPHWLQFSPPPSLNHYILAALYCVVMIVGMVGNALVIFMFVRCRALQTPANILVMNLAVSDFLLMSKMPIFVYNSLYCGPMLGEIGCQIYGFVGGLTGTVSITTLAAIALDRYYVIVSPIRKTTRCRARLSVVFAWCYGSVFSLLPLLGLGLGSYVPEGYLTSCSFDYLDFSFDNRLFIFIFFLAAWLIPFCIITMCYIGICRVVVLSRNVKHIVGEDSSRHEKKRSEIRLAGVVIGIIGLWFAAWTPYAVVALFGITGKKEYITPLSSMIPALFCKTASCMDPYVYAVTHPKFRQEVSSLIRRISSKSNFRMERNRSSRAWSTQYEMSETCRYQVSQKDRQNSEDLSDIEEIVVVLESKCKNKGLVSSSDENTLGIGNIDEGVFKENDSAADTSQRQRFPISKAESGL